MDEARAIMLGGEIVYAEKCDYTSYLSLGLYCPSCGEPVHLKLGILKKPHFAHFPQTIGRKFESCPMRFSSDNDSVYRNRYAVNRNQSLEIFQKYFFSIIIHRFDKVLLKDWDYSREDIVDSFISNTTNLENSFSPKMQILKDSTINIFRFDKGLNFGRLNYSYTKLEMDHKRFANIKSVAREVLEYLSVQSSKYYLSCFIVRTINILYEDLSFREELNLKNIENINVNHVHYGLIYIIASIDWIYAMDKADINLRREKTGGR